MNRSSSFDVVAPFYDISAGSVVNSLVSHFSQQPQPNLTAGSSDILFNAPRLFVVSKDGSGIELHRDKGLYLYFRERIHSKSSEIIEETLFGEAGSVCVTLLTESDDTNIMKERSSKNIVFRQVKEFK